MFRRSQKLANLLFLRGLARQVVPVAIVWSAVDWYRVNPWYAAAFLLLTGNYLAVWVMGWVARSLLSGPWRVRPWQTAILIVNFITLPIVFYRAHHQIVWGFIGINLLLFVALYVSTAILFYLGEHLPMGQVFAQARTVDTPAPEPAAGKTGSVAAPPRDA